MNDTTLISVSQEIYSELVETKHLTDQQVKSLFATFFVKMIANTPDGTFFCTSDRLSEFTGASSSTERASLNSFVDMGILEVVEDNKANPTKSKVYRLSDWAVKICGQVLFILQKEKNTITKTYYKKAVAQILTALRSSWVLSPALAGKQSLSKAARLIEQEGYRTVGALAMGMGLNVRTARKLVADFKKIGAVANDPKVVGGFIYLGFGAFIKSSGFSSFLKKQESRRIERKRKTKEWLERAAACLRHGKVKLNRPAEDAEEGPARVIQKYLDMRNAESVDTRVEGSRVTMVDKKTKFILYTCDLRDDVVSYEHKSFFTSKIKQTEEQLNEMRTVQELGKAKKNSPSIADRLAAL